MNGNMAKFEIKDCAIISRLAGVQPAINLRELRERVEVCPQESLFHHFCETVIRPSFDDPRLRNDFSLWTLNCLGDNVLSERLGVINPYEFFELENLREFLISVLDTRLDEQSCIPWVKASEPFIFMSSNTIVFRTGVLLSNPAELLSAFREMSTSSIYYHFVDGKRRTPRGRDDFSAWLLEFWPEENEILDELAEIDFYFLNLLELKETLSSKAEKLLFVRKHHE
jgi:hypothetical protein